MSGTIVQEAVQEYKRRYKSTRGGTIVQEAVQWYKRKYSTRVQDMRGTVVQDIMKGTMRELASGENTSQRQLL